MNKRIIEVNKSEASKTVHSHNRKAGPKGQGKRNNRRGRKLSESEVLKRKSRMVGSDDMTNAANCLKYAEHEGLHGPALQVAHAAAVGLQTAVQYSTRNRHRDAAASAGASLYSIRRNERVAKMKVQCRDGQHRTVQKVLEWYTGVHGRIAGEIEAALDKEAANAAAKAKAAEAATEGAMGIEVEEAVEAKTA